MPDFALFLARKNEGNERFMKRQIEVHGAYFEEDQQGFLINPASLSSVHPDWMAPIAYICDALKKNFGTALHSIYLRGSVAAGYGVSGFSDLDMFVLIASEEAIYWEPIPESKEWTAFCRENFPVFNSLDIYKSTYSTQLYKESPALSSVIKTQSLCLYGEDLGPLLPDYKAGKQMQLHLKWLREDLDDFYENDTDAKACQDIMKVLLRAAFDLVMEKDGRYTNSLYFCWRSFSEQYPEREKDFQQALLWYLNPITEKALLTAYLKENGEWLYKEACRLKMIDTAL